MAASKRFCEDSARASFHVPSNPARLPSKTTVAGSSRVLSNPARLPSKITVAGSSRVPSKPASLPSKINVAGSSRVRSNPASLPSKTTVAGSSRVLSKPASLPSKINVAGSSRVLSASLLSKTTVAGSTRIPSNPASLPSKTTVAGSSLVPSKPARLLSNTTVAGSSHVPSKSAKLRSKTTVAGSSRVLSSNPPSIVSKTSAAASFRVRPPSKTTAAASFRVPSNPAGKTTAAASCRVPSNPASLLSKTTTAAASFRVPSNPANPENPSAATSPVMPKDDVAAAAIEVRPKHAAKKLRLRAVENPVSPEPEMLCFRINNKYTNHGSRFYFIDTKALLEPDGEALLEPDGDSGDLLEYVHPYPPPYLGPPVPLFKPIYCTPNLPTSVCSEYSTAAFVGGCLYMIGGFANGLPLEDVYRLDLARYIPRLVKHPRLLFRYQHNPNWVKCKSMNSPKSSPQCVVVDGKIYVFGRKAERVMTTPCVEVYSPNKDEWEQLNCDWPDYATVEPILGALSDQNDKKHILLQPSYGSYYETSLYTYNIDMNTLTMQRKYQPFQPALGRQHAVVDGILYCYQDDLSHLGKDAGIVGYDLSGRYKWTPIPVFGLWPHLRFPLEHIQLVGIGKNFLCVLCMMDDLRFNNNNCNREYMKGTRELFIMTFKISRLKRNPATRRPGDPSIILNASHVSTKSYLIPRGYGSLLNCLVFQDTSQPCFG